MRRSWLRPAFFTLCVLAGTGSASTALAQSAPESRSTGALEEILVTAERVSESLQTVPVSVTAFSASELAGKQIVNTLDLVR